MIECTRRQRTMLERKQGIQNTCIENSQGNITVDQRQILKIWEHYVTELCDREDRPQNIEAETEEVVEADEKGPYILRR